MCLTRTVSTVFAFTALSLAIATASAGEKHDHDHGHDHDKRQHDAHVHGIAALNLALEGKELHIELDSPAANIVGFEHAPSSKADHAAIDKAVAILKDGSGLFRFNADAGCEMKDVKITSELTEDEHHDHDKHSDDHDHEKKAKHDHKDHDHDHEHEGEVHSDIEVAYHFECSAPGKLTQLTVELFEAFSGMEKLKVQYVIEAKQGAAELTASKHVITF